mgnify:CR=1 FL=1
MNKLRDYIELTKPRIMLLVLVTTVIGYFLAGRGIASYQVLLFCLIGTALSCGGSAVLNNYLERDIDCLMRRTCKRPIPSGKIGAPEALSFGVLLVLSGVSLLALKVNILTAFLALLTAFLYVVIYTPLKRITWLNTFIGAIPGALPPVGGWTAAVNEIQPGAVILFLLLFIWQHPHFYAIALMFKEDYARAGFKMLPVVEPDGKSTIRQMIVYSVLLIPVSLLPTIFGMSGWIYFTGALLSGIALLWASISLSLTRTDKAARKVLKASVIYLPILLTLIVSDIRL